MITYRLNLCHLSLNIMLFSLEICRGEHKNCSCNNCHLVQLFFQQVNLFCFGFFYYYFKAMCGYLFWNSTLSKNVRCNRKLLRQEKKN